MKEIDEQKILIELGRVLLQGIKKENNMIPLEISTKIACDFFMNGLFLIKIKKEDFQHLCDLIWNHLECLYEDEKNDL